MRADRSIEAIEKDIDETFSASKLLDTGYAQAVWTLLSMNEDAYLKAIHTLSGEELHIFADSHLNALTYPLRACLERCSMVGQRVQTVLIDEHYQQAWDWLRAADDYAQFCSIFPLWHRGRVGLSVAGNYLLVNHRSSPDRRYEAYNRLIRKDARSSAEIARPDDSLIDEIDSCTSVGDDWFRVNFNPRLVKRLISFVELTMSDRHTLPDDWQFKSFSLREYRTIFLAIQSMLYAWHIARTMAANSGLPGLGYKSSVWVVDKEELLSRLRRYTGVEPAVIRLVLGLLSFGAGQIRTPDIALQPLVDLRNGSYALSPFVWLNSNKERNLCVLMNQIPEQRERYSELSNEKEDTIREEIIELLSVFGYEHRCGEVAGTNIDLAIIDRANKVCLCLELKWFIEPAEIREIEDRTKDLAKGVAQCKMLNTLFERNDTRMVQTVLSINPSYSFLSAVGSVNWIGFGEVQDPDVPIIKVLHLVEKIKEKGSLSETVRWLKSRDYLPQEERDYSVVPAEISCGRWSTTWYGIKPITR
jgi:hypothetical protein